MYNTDVFYVVYNTLTGEQLGMGHDWSDAIVDAFGQERNEPVHLYGKVYDVGTFTGRTFDLQFPNDVRYRVDRGFGEREIRYVPRSYKHESDMHTRLQNSIKQ